MADVQAQAEAAAAADQFHNWDSVGSTWDRVSSDVSSSYPSYNYGQGRNGFNLGSSWGKGSPTPSSYHHSDSFLSALLDTSFEEGIGLAGMGFLFIFLIFCLITGLCK
jgi:hypothetical protein